MKYVLILTVVGLAFGAFGLIAAISWYNGAIDKQESIQAQYRDNQNAYDCVWKKVREVAQVPSQYKEDLKDLLVTETGAKYGKDGSRATMQWFQDRNIALPEGLYRDLTNVIESGRNDFARGQ